jgi:hypothetical protein
MRNDEARRNATFWATFWCGDVNAGWRLKSTVGVIYLE